MIAVSILMGIWAAGLQIMQRRSARNNIQSTEGAVRDDIEKEMVTDTAKA